MSTKSNALAESGTPTHVTRFDGVRVPASDYRPVWLDSLADDVAIEGSAMNGIAQGAEAVRSLVTYIRTLYDSQEFQLRRALWGATAFSRTTPLGFAASRSATSSLVTRNPAGRAQHIVANYRPRSTLLLLSRLIGDHFAGTPIGEHFATSKE